MKNFKWTKVEDPANVDWLPQGGYVIEIVDVDDMPSWETLNIVFDVAEGEHAHKFADVPSSRAWTHQLRQSYSEKAQRFFKGFLTALEQSNPNFTIEEWERDCDETQLIGLKFGAIINYYHYVNEKGVLCKKYNLVRPVSVDKIHKGDFDVPEDNWSNEAKRASEESNDNAASDSKQGNLYSDVPF